MRHSQGRHPDLLSKTKHCAPKNYDHLEKELNLSDLSEGFLGFTRERLEIMVQKTVRV
jgi:hypothetical protein